MPTDTSEKGLESLIVNHLIELEKYIKGESQDFDREHAIDIVKLLEFLSITQGEKIERIGIQDEGIKRAKFLNYLQGEIARKGIIEVLRKPLKYESVSLDLYYCTPSKANLKAKELYQTNIFSVTRQLQYSKDETRRALDFAIFINGLPIITFELKNSLTKQTVHDAVEQYKQDRDPRELLFAFGRCMVHFALDDHEIRMCTHLEGKASWFLPFNKGFNDGAGNPPNPKGLKTDYLWKEVLTKESLANILENYAQIIEEKDKKGKKKYKLVFPRYHQLEVTKKLLADAQNSGAGKRYLIQHSAGSGKSNSIAWLAHQLIGLEKENKPIFDSVIVITDRRILDKQIKDTIKSFAQVSSIVGHSEHSSDLKDFLKSGKRIIITTVQKFPFIVEGIGQEHRNNKFAIIIDEAHSSQGGRATAKMNIALSENGEEDEEESFEDQINRLMESRKILSNASYFAFTATPKNKTLELFGEAFEEAGKVKHKPFHNYSMKQAIQEGFIIDVLENYTPIKSYYKLIKSVEDDPQYDSKRAKKKLRKYVESNDHAIQLKAEIMIDHFHEQVVAKNKIGGKARGMVITSGIQRAIQYYFAIKKYLEECKLPYKAIVAFTGEPEYNGQKVTEASLNGFPSKEIASFVKEDPYRLLIVADKFQTGYDEPLLHTMYVDKPLTGIKTVQTLSRLNRAHPKKHDAFVLDFINDSDNIQKDFERYYRTTILSEETDPNKLHIIQSDLEAYQVFNWEQVDILVQRFLSKASREDLDPILDRCIPLYKELDEDGQVNFKGKAKGFVRTYSFLASILPYSNAEWEKLSIFLNFLIPKLPAPIEEDLSRGILEAIDMDSYRVEKQATIKISLADENQEIEPVPTSTGGIKADPELDYLSNILQGFNDQFGNIDWQDADKIRHLIAVEIPTKVAENKKYQNAMKQDKQNARMEHDEALKTVLNSLMADHIELFRQYSDNPSFRRWLSDSSFEKTYKKVA
jgi:type I restriction enzyme R subunit